MKIARFATATSGPRYGFCEGDSIRLCEGTDPWALKPTGVTVALKGAQLLAPCQPSKVIGVGQNYRAHAAEMGKPIPSEPVLFMKPPTAIIGTGQAIEWPSGYERIDYEGELAVVIGRRCRHVPAARALEVVLGYAVMNDVSVRDLQKKDGQFTRAKGFDTFAPFGPWIETAAAGELNPLDAAIETRLNGEVRQQSSTSDMIFSVPVLIEVITRVMTLLPGDVITTGTPSGVGPIKPGDRVAITIDGIGTLENPVVLEPARPTEETAP
jgi:2-keto-4-pentenoate hydratase/2-oxohepta-3-ene-1,7-dioic acid hydratase in catechol pathway